ncbi:uncharacterized protein [Diadema setosum]|uniref:uncharacterized protein n=1 Tax=Diadema setosum TaxID=31175 RepID=UPI003B3B76BC
MFPCILQAACRGSVLGGRIERLLLTSARNAGNHVVSGTPAVTSGSGKQSKLPILPNTLTSSTSNNACPPADSLTERLSKLSLSPAEASLTLQYVFPEASSHGLGAILDPVATVAIPLDCPTHNDKDLTDLPVDHRYNDNAVDDPDTSTTITKKASNILQKRHRKMKRHQYLKWRKRNRFKLRMQKQRKRKRNRKRWERHLNKFRFAGLKPLEGEKYLEKKQAKLNIFLRYLGVQVDDATSTDEEVTKKKKKGPTCVLLPGGTRKIVPEPILPERARRR